MFRNFNTVVQLINIAGIQDFSVMSSFHYFDLAKSIAVDSMHGLYSGVTKMMIGLWLDTCHHKEPWYCKIKEIDHNLMSIKPPSEITKCP